MIHVEVPYNEQIVDDLFGFYFKWFYLCGVPLKHYKKSILYELYSSFILTNAYVVVIAMSLDVILHSDELDRIMETSRVIVPASSSLWVHMILRFQIKDVKRMLSYASVFTWDPIPNTDPEDRRFRMTRLLPLINSATTKVFIGSFGLHACYMTSRLIIRDDRPLAINAYFIIDTTYSPFYELANVSEYLMTLICFPLFYGAIGMYCYLVTIACSQLERLKVNILKIKSSMDSAKDKGPITKSTFYRMQKQLDECISHHQNILRLMHSLEEVCSPMLVCHFVLILGGMCFAGFSFVVSLGNGLTMAQSVVVYTAFLIQLYAYCWFGGELTDLAESVRNAAWECEWVGTPVEYQRCLVSMIFMSSKEFTLTAGKFVPVSRRTMMNVINQTISFVMFLIQVKDGGNSEELTE